ncbi:hypothetical protein [Bacillus mycoides]|uniref:Uncharacterized protein n=1 Tax=Bacillus mycoides TaxID=1405 RepID=A0A1G4EWK5_BACMY|nr:Protein of unknown function [Bacillus mycoides]
MSLGKLIGRGNTAEVFELSDKEVLKLFYEKVQHDKSYILQSGKKI